MGAIDWASILQTGGVAGVVVVGMTMAIVYLMKYVIKQHERMSNSIKENAKEDMARALEYANEKTELIKAQFEQKMELVQEQADRRIRQTESQIEVFMGHNDENVRQILRSNEKNTQELMRGHERAIQEIVSVMTRNTEKLDRIHDDVRALLGHNATN